MCLGMDAANETYIFKKLVTRTAKNKKYLGYYRQQTEM